MPEIWLSPTISPTVIFGFGFRVTLLPGRLWSRGGAAALVLWVRRSLFLRAIFGSRFAFGCVLIVVCLSWLLTLCGYGLWFLCRGM